MERLGQRTQRVVGHLKKFLKEKTKTKGLKQYGFSQQACKVVAPIIELIEQNHFEEAARRIARLSLELCDKIKNHSVSPKEGDDYLTLIYLYTDDYYPKFLELKKEINDILFEGMMLHDYGKDYGANLNTIRMLAKKVLEE